PDWVKNHVTLYLESGGTDGHMWDSAIAGGPGPIPTLLLAASGRKTGEAHTVPLIYSKTEGGFVVIASRAGTLGGKHTHPKSGSGEDARQRAR
ncbi:MAG: nitroreductase family deazaflavin-dependent oxidoreductase, partial [Proteobacteria bacterium]|nr:nitroreductase family deazaflavin-dependent oxidoreductase [Pseudomonadota bacterium]